MRRLDRSGLCVLLLLATALPLAGNSTPAAAGRSGDRFLRGMVVSCPRWGPIWGSPAMAEALAELKTLGVEWVAIHPYAWVKTDGRVEFRAAAELDFLADAVRLAREASVELFWKPHLGYWGSFDWRGEIAFGDDRAAWRRFFDQYRAFIVDQARFAEAHGVPLFALGTELEKTTGHEAEWRRILAEVRSVYSGTVVYAANWDRLDRVPFWDAVDWIGVHAYFPLSEADDPGAEALAAGWDHHLAELGTLSRTTGKPVLFAEIGYNRSPRAAREPWSYDTHDTPASRQLRRRLIETALARAERETFLRGLFWWKWIPGFAPWDRDFSMKDPEARAALAAAWGPRRTPPATTGR